MPKKCAPLSSIKARLSNGFANSVTLSTDIFNTLDIAFMAPEYESKKYSGAIKVNAQMISKNIKSEKSIQFQELSIDSSNFYLDSSHRSAKAIISGGVPGETIKLTKVKMSYGTGHYDTWNKKLAQTWTFNSKGQIILTDNCSTGHCTFSITLKIEYRGQTKEITLNVDTN